MSSEPAPVRLLLIAGTRPEVLKLAPVLAALRSRGGFDARFCLSGQHPEIARKVAAEVGIAPDVELDGEGGPLTLTEGLSRLLSRVDGLLARQAPRGVVVQGDTTTTLAGALASFHHGVPVFHVEAGLRTSTPKLPFPEETNRRLISRIADLHFAPTARARDNLLREGVPESSVSVTGNTVVDALGAFGRRGAGAAEALLGPRDPSRHHVVVTLHRRENAEAGARVARAVQAIARRGDVDVTWIGHPNVTSRNALNAMAGTPGVRVLPAQPYATFVAILERARLVLTDSGGVQEEAPALGVPVVVLRAETDRPEAVEAGNAVIAGSDEAAIVRACGDLLDDPETSAKRSRVVSPFGDGRAAERIAALLAAFYAPGGS